MQVTINFGYEQVLELARQLRPEERRRLALAVSSEHEEVEAEFEARKRRAIEKAMQCPVVSEDELKGFEEARKEINECRLASL